MNLPIIKHLVKEYGEKLINEIALIVYKNGQGDCYGCLCSDYCNKGSCFDSIKLVIYDLLEDKSEEGDEE